MTHGSAPDQRRRFALAKDVVLQVIGEDALVLNLRDETVFSLNPTAVRIAELLVASVPVAAAIDALCAEYGATRDEVSRDVEDLAAALTARRLLVPIGGEESA